MGENQEFGTLPFGLAALLIGAALLLVLLVHTQDASDAERQAEHCQHMVETGAWPAEVCK